MPNGFVFSPDGRYLYGSSYYTGVSNIFRYDLEAKKVEAVTNTETGFFRPVPLADGRLLVFRYTGRGFVPAWIDPKPLEDVSAITFLGERLVEEQPVLKSWMLDSPAEGPVRHDGEAHGHVSTWPAACAASRSIPIVEGYKDTARSACALNLSDPLLLNRLPHHRRLVAGHVDLPRSERCICRREYERYDWRAQRVVQPRRFLRSLRPDEDRPQGLQRARRPHAAR